MPVEVVMPKFGLTMQEGTIQQWFKAEGDAVTAGESLFEVETEKVLYEVEAPATGTVAKLLYPVEAVVPVARAVAVIALAGEDPVSIAASFVERAAAASAPEATAAAPAARPVPAAKREGPIAATPAARKLAKDHGIDLATVAGSGPGGRISREDVEAALAAEPAVQGQPLRGMRKTIAERMWRSLQSTAQLTMHTEADVSALVERYTALRQQFTVTYTDLLIEAMAQTLREHPVMRVTCEADHLVAHDSINIGIAVALDDGLIVPVLRNADQKSLEEISTEARALAQGARAGTLGVDAYSGGLLTITNLGMYGIDGFTPIINLPQVAILGVGRIQKKPAVVDGNVVVRSMLTLSLTIDHRIVDGAPGAAFLRDLVRRLSA